MHLDLSGSTAIVTGGANGIGRACAEALEVAGAVVWIFDPEASGTRGRAVDVTDRSALDAAFSATGPPDIVVANAGMARVEPITETSEETWRRTIELNLTGVFHTVQAAARLMKPRRHGAIVLTA
ncbi:MAG: SDR family NAD(P)-dependent oxidoreductase, partial [Bryobacteraceae bacterium]